MLAFLVLLFLTGLVLLAVEVLLLPGFGVAGVAGILAVAASLVWAASYGPAVPALLLLSLAAAGVLVFYLLRRFGLRRLRGLVLGERLDSAGGYLASGDLTRLAGAEGRALTPLRPAGTALLAGERVAVVSQGEFIPAGAAVRVVLIEGQRVVVQEVRKVL